MKKTVASLALAFAALTASAQSSPNTFPPAAFSARTVAIVNDTHTAEVTEGAQTALKSWGEFRVIDDPESADLTLRFDKARERDERERHTTDASGQSSDSFSTSFGSSVHMKAYLKDADTPFYSTKTSDSKKKAGINCVNDFRSAWQSARHQPQP